MSIRIYCDQNFLINIGWKRGRYRDCLRRLVSSKAVTFVLSPGHWVEMAQGRNDAGSLALADFADSLEPLWIRERRTLQRHEVEQVFFDWLGIQYSRPSPLTSRAEVIADISRNSVRAVESIGSRDFVEYLRRLPEGKNPVIASYQKNVTALKVNRKAVEEGRLTADIRNRVNRVLILGLLPSRTPNGLVIDKPTKNRFVRQLDIQSFPSIAVELAVTESTWQGTGGLTLQDLADRMHIISSLPYADIIATNDIRFTELIRRIEGLLSFPIAGIVSKEEFDRSYLRWWHVAGYSLNLTFKRMSKSFSSMLDFLD